MKQTSIRAYHQIKHDGTLTKLQHKVYEAIKFHGPMTGKQISRTIPGGWKRLSELCKIGVVAILGTKIDEETNKQVNVYEITGQLPLCDNPVKRKPSAKALQMLIDKMAQGRDISTLYAKAYEQGYKDAKSGYDMPEEL